jgi:hypothetical protein
MPPAVVARMNSFIETKNHTYYFSMSTGERKKQREK